MGIFDWLGGKIRMKVLASGEAKVAEFEAAASRDPAFKAAVVGVIFEIVSHYIPSHAEHEPEDVVPILRGEFDMMDPGTVRSLANTLQGEFGKIDAAHATAGGIVSSWMHALVLRREHTSDMDVFMGSRRIEAAMSELGKLAFAREASAPKRFVPNPDLPPPPVSPPASQINKPDPSRQR